MAPLLRRTWSPRGHTPVLYQKTRHHRKVSVIAALWSGPGTLRFSLYFRLHPDANINSVVVVSFLRCLLKEVSGTLLIVWDRFQPHRSQAVQKLLTGTDRLHVEFFPPYAPELNPVENVWSYTKMNPLANFTALDSDSLAATSRRALRSLQYNKDLLRSFFKKSGLSLCRK